MVKCILKNNGPHTITAPQSSLRNPIVNPIRAGTLPSPSMDIAPDFHLTENPTGRPTTEVVDPSSTTMNTETIISKPQTRRIERSLLPEPLSYKETLISPSFSNSQPENEAEDPRHIMTDETNMRLNPHHVLQMTYHNRTNSGPTPQIELQNIRVKPTQTEGR